MLAGWLAGLGQEEKKKKREDGEDRRTGSSQFKGATWLVDALRVVFEDPLASPVLCWAGRGVGY